MPLIYSYIAKVKQVNQKIFSELTKVCMQQQLLINDRINGVGERLFDEAQGAIPLKMLDPPYIIKFLVYASTGGSNQKCPDVLSAADQTRQRARRAKIYLYRVGQPFLMGRSFMTPHGCTIDLLKQILFHPRC